MSSAVGGSCASGSIGAPGASTRHSASPVAWKAIVAPAGASAENRLKQPIAARSAASPDAARSTATTSAGVTSSGTRRAASSGATRSVVPSRGSRRSRPGWQPSGSTIRTASPARSVNSTMPPPGTVSRSSPSTRRGAAAAKASGLATVIARAQAASGMARKAASESSIASIQAV